MVVPLVLLDFVGEICAARLSITSKAAASIIGVFEAGRRTKGCLEVGNLHE
jgi:hypothetical protein